MATLLERLAVAVKAAAGIFSDTSSQAAYQMLDGVYGASRGEAPDRGLKGQLDAFSTMPRARAAFGLIASSMAAVDWKVYVARDPVTRRAVKDIRLQRAVGTSRKDLLQSRLMDGDAEELIAHPALEVLHGGGPLLPGVAMRRVAQLHVDLAGEAFLVKERTGLGVPVGAWPIPPTWVQETPTPQHPFYRVQYRGWGALIPEVDILWVRDVNPANPYGRGVGYGLALADELEADEYSAKTIRQVFFNRAQPDFLVFPKAGEMVKAETARLEQDWVNRLQGYWRAWKPHFLSREVGVYEFQKDYRAMQLTELRTQMRDAIFQTLGIPPEQLGVVESSNRATIEASDLIFAKNVLVPRLELWRSYFQEYLMPEYDQKLIVDYVTPVTDDREFYLKVAQAAPWTLDTNEWRALMGRAAMDDDDAGASRMAPMNVAPVDLTHDAMAREMDRGTPPEVVEPDEDGKV